jgi:hypothetical protein
MDRSRKIGTLKRNPVQGASGKTGNALGPLHMGGNPAGRAQVRGQATSASGVYKATGKRGQPRNLNQTAVPQNALGGPGVVGFKQNVAGQSFDFKTCFENFATSSGTFTSTSVPAGMTLNSTTGVLSGTPTTVATGTPTITVIAATGVPASLAVPWKWSVTA